MARLIVRQPPEVEVILKSACFGRPDIATVRARYWRPIHAEVMTHRKFTRNASSSRAVPVEKLAAASEEMYVPLFRENRSGMQPGEYLSPKHQAEAEAIWEQAADFCLDSARKLAGLGVHKQWANRMLEWFGYINVLITTTDFDNFFDLRLAEDEDGWPIPQDEMFVLAEHIKAAVEAAPVQLLKVGQWHLPYVEPLDKLELELRDQKLVSVARCASISYQTVDGKPMTSEKARGLGDRLMTRKHWSPFEHQAMADEKIEGFWATKSCHANFDGWAQWRQILEGK